MSILSLSVYSILENLKANNFCQLAKSLPVIFFVLLGILSCQQQRQSTEWSAPEEVLAWYKDFQAGGGQGQYCLSSFDVEPVSGEPSLVSSEPDPITSATPGNEGAEYPRQKTVLQVNGDAIYVYEWQTADLKEESIAIDKVVGISSADNINDSLISGACFVAADEPL